MVHISTCLSLTALALITTSSAHSWNEQLSIIGSNGSYAGAYGYPRGYVARTDPGFTGESDKYPLPSLESGRTAIDSTDLPCHPSQRTPTQAANYPRLKVAPGSTIAMKYLENGHVTLPQNQPGKPSNRGTVYVYGTTEPSSTEKLVDVIRWTKDGSGGDKRGRLLTAQNYDDGRCHQINSGTISTQRQQAYPDPVPGQPGTHNELWCETDVTIPDDASLASPGKALTLYWVWDWPYLPGSPGLAGGKQEWYTTCSDVDVVAQEPNGPISNTLPQQDPMLDAVADYKSRPVDAQYTVPSYFTWPGATESYQPGGATPTATPHSAAASTLASSAVTAPSQTPNSPHSAGTTPTPAALQFNQQQSQAQAQTLMSVFTVTAVMQPGVRTMMIQGDYSVLFTVPADAASTTPASPQVTPTAAARVVKRDSAADVKAEVAGGQRFRMHRW